MSPSCSNQGLGQETQGNWHSEYHETSAPSLYKLIPFAVTRLIVSSPSGIV